MISGWENRNIHASSEVIRGISDWAEADVSVIERAPSATIAPGNPARAALHIALSEREAAEARHQHAEQAEQCGRELVIASEWVLIAFGDVDVIIA